MKNKLLLGGGIFILILILGVGIAYADTNGGVINACVKDNGQVRIVSGTSDCKNNETYLQWNIIGPQGPKGDIGGIGPTGLQGPKGDKGDTGITGPAGPQGPQGDKGDTGVAGPAGPQGPQGDKGDKGDTGITGPAGPQGPQGPKGDTGAGITSINDLACEIHHVPGKMSTTYSDTGIVNQLQCNLEFTCPAFTYSYLSGYVNRFPSGLLAQGLANDLGIKFLRIYWDNGSGYQVRVNDLLRYHGNEDDMVQINLGSRYEFRSLSDGQLNACFGILMDIITNNNIPCTGDFCSW